MTGQQIEVSSDEDWKSRVKAEDAAFDQQFRGSEPEGAGGAEAPVGGPTRSSDTSAKPQESARQEGARRSAPTQGGARGSAPPQEGARHSAPTQVPEATFVGLLGMFSTQAMMGIGLITNPVTKKVEKDLPMARYFIDLISVLEQKTAGNLDRDEAAALDETLHTLRMAYVQRSKETV